MVWTIKFNTVSLSVETQVSLEAIHLTSCAVIDLPFAILSCTAIGVVFSNRMHEGVVKIKIRVLHPMQGAANNSIKKSSNQQIWRWDVPTRTKLT